MPILRYLYSFWVRSSYYVLNNKFIFIRRLYSDDFIHSRLGRFTMCSTTDQSHRAHMLGWFYSFWVRSFYLVLNNKFIFTKRLYSNDSIHFDLDRLTMCSTTNESHRAPMLGWLYSFLARLSYLVLNNKFIFTECLYSYDSIYSDLGRLTMCLTTNQSHREPMLGWLYSFRARLSYHVLHQN